MRSRLLAALVPALLLTGVPAGQAAPPPAAVSEMVLDGRAGDLVVVTFTTPVLMNNAGADLTLHPTGAAWAGVVIGPARGNPVWDHYIAYRLTERLMCPGRRCASPHQFQPTVGYPDDGIGHIVLRPGTYAIAVVGPERARIKATLRLPGAPAGRMAPVLRRGPAYRGATFSPSVPVPTEAVSKGFARLDNPEHRAVVDSVATALTVPRAAGDQQVQVPGQAAWELQFCTTRGGRRNLDMTPGGLAPCQDFSGQDFTWTFGPGTVGPVGPYVTNPAIGFGGGIWAAEPSYDSVGGGYQADVVSPDSRVVGVYVAVAMP